MKVAVSQLSFTYPGGVQALSEVSLNIESGEKVAIIGQNGADAIATAQLRFPPLPL